MASQYDSRFGLYDPDQLNLDALSAGFKETAYPAEVPCHFDNNSSSGFMMNWILNYTGKDLYVYHPGFGINAYYKFSPTHVESFRSVRYVEIKAMVHTKPYPDMFRGPNTGVFCTHKGCRIKDSRLRQGAVYLAKYGVAVAFAEFQDKLEEVHPFSELNRRKAIEQQYQRFVSDHAANYQQMLHISANDPTGSVKHIYAYINGILTAHRVSNEPDQPEFVVLRIPNNTDGHLSIEFDALKAFDSMDTQTVNDVQWSLGQDSYMLTKEYMTAKRKACIPKEELNEQLKLQEIRHKQAMDEMKRNLETLHMKERGEVATRIMNIRLAMERSKFERDTETAKLQKEYQREEYIRRLELEKLKLEREKAANQANNASVWASIAKSLAVIMPIVASIVSMMAKRAKGTSSLGIITWIFRTARYAAGFAV